MNRAEFLKRVGLATAGLAVGVPAATAAANVPAPELEAAPLTEWAASREMILSAGGLCTPVSPYYELHHIAPLMPLLRADRGGILYAKPVA